MTDKDKHQIEEESLEQQGLEKSAPSGRATKVWMLASIVLFAALIYVIIQPPFDKNGETVASVNGVSISRDMFYDEMVKSSGPSILDNLIFEELLDQKAEEAGVKVTDSDIDSDILMIKKSFQNDEEWAVFLTQNGTTEEKLRIDIAIQVQLRKLLEPQTPVTDEEIKLYFEKNLEAMSTPDKTPTLEEKKEEIRYQLIYQKVYELMPAWIEEIKAKAEIENSLEVK